jgi:hypothetical protein
MSTTQIRGSQILDGSIGTADIDDNLEREFTKVRTTRDDLAAGFLSTKIVAGSNVTVTVVGASGSDQTLRIAASSGGGGGTSLMISGSADGIQYSSTPASLVFDDQTGFEVTDLGDGSAKVSIASHYKNIYVDGQPSLIATGSDSLEIRSAGGISLTTSITDTDADGTAKELLISAVPLSSSLSSSISDIQSQMFVAATNSLPYYGSSAQPATLPPPPGERSSYVLGWINDQISWVPAMVGVSFVSATWAEISFEASAVLDVGFVEIIAGAVA